LLKFSEVILSQSQSGYLIARLCNREACSTAEHDTAVISTPEGGGGGVGGGLVVVLLNGCDLDIPSFIRNRNRRRELLEYWREGI